MLTLSVVNAASEVNYNDNVSLSNSDLSSQYENNHEPIDTIGFEEEIDNSLNQNLDKNDTINNKYDFEDASLQTSNNSTDTINLNNMFDKMDEDKSIGSQNKSVNSDNFPITDEILKNNTFTKYPSRIILNNITTYALSNITLNAEVLNDLNDSRVNEGFVVFKINGITIGLVDVIDGMASLNYDISNLSAFNYNITAKYGGYKEYLNSNTSSILSIQRRPVLLNVSNLNTLALEEIELNCTVLDDILKTPIKSGKVAFKLNGLTIGHGNITNGSASIKYNTSQLSAKNYNITVVFGATKHILNQTSNATLNIIKRDVTVNVDNKIIYYGNKVNLSSQIKDLKNNQLINGGIAVYKVNSLTVGNSSVINGKSSIIYDSSMLGSKKYNITVIYSGNKYYIDSNKNGTLLVQKRPIKLNLSADNLVYMGDDVIVHASIIDYEGKNVDFGQIYIKNNNSTITSDKLNKGSYSFSSTKIGVGVYNLTIDYDGQNRYESIIKTSKLTLKALPKLSISSIKTYPKKINITVKVNGEYKNQSNAYVEFKLNNQVIGKSNIINSSVILQYDVSKLKGNYTIKVTYYYQSKQIGVDNTTKLEVLPAKTYTFSQIANAAVNLRNLYESNHIVDEITVGSTKVEVQDFLALMINAIKNVNSKKSSSTITRVYYDTPLYQIDQISKGTIYLKEYLSIGTSVLNYMNKNKIAPTYMNSSRGKFGYYNMLYTYSKVLDLSTTSYLVSGVTVYNWNTIHPSNPKTRHIYISSDNILGKSKDTNFMNQIISKLKSKGYTVSSIGIGPNTHNTKIWAGSLPSNAVQVSVFGGSDAGVIKDICTRSFMRTKANRLLFLVYYPTAKDITNLSWLERAHDDNYSPKSFKGISNPSNYLKSHGYDYVRSSNIDTIVNAIIEYIS